MAKRHAQGQRTARENIADLCDAGSFIEYGQLAVAAQAQPPQHGGPHRQHPGRWHGDGHRRRQRRAVRRRKARTVVMAYDATVLAGTRARATTPRPTACWALRSTSNLPVVLFAEGGGGRRATPTSPWSRACM